MAHELTLLSAEARTLRQANEALSKLRRAKKNRIRQGSTLAVEDVHNIISQAEVDEQIRRDEHIVGGQRKERKSTVRCCSICKKPGHNAQTCQEVVDVSSSSDSE